MKQLTWIFCLLLYATPCLAQSLDIYGGDASHACVGVLQNGSAIPAPTGFFYLYKDTSIKHWMLCDPLGNRFWIVGMQDAGTYPELAVSATAKYGATLYTPSYLYGNPQVVRLKDLHFNAIGEYAHVGMLPVSTQANDGGNTAKLPFIWLVQPSLKSGAKEWMSALPPAYSGFRGGFKDVYDTTRFAGYINPAHANIDANFFSGVSELDATPYFIGTTMDDCDELTGFCVSTHPHLGWLAGISAPYWGTFGTGDEILYTKQAWINAMTAKYTTIAALNAAWGGGANYSSFGTSATSVTGEVIGTGNGVTTSFSHTFAHGVVDPMSVGISVAGVISAQDCPWFRSGTSFFTTCGGGSAGTGTIDKAGITSNITDRAGAVTYASGGATCGGQAAPCITVTFSVAPANGVSITALYQYGGWPKATAGGTGLMDEDGSSAWYPADSGLASCQPGPCSTTIATDLDNFLGSIAQEYFSTVSAAIRAILPHHLVIGPDAVHSNIRTKVMQQLEAYVDVEFDTFSFPVGGDASSQANSIANYNANHIPVMEYSAIAANVDSPFGGPPGCNGWPCFPTQAARGLGYYNFILTWLNQFRGSDGYGFVVGIDWWQFIDNSAETTNFGILSRQDNLYGSSSPCSKPFKEDVNSSIVDFLGFTTFTETATYGDAMCQINLANLLWLNQNWNATGTVSRGHLP